MSLPNCPQCSSEYTYEMGALLVCPMCNHEWSLSMDNPVVDGVKDANGTLIVDGDSVVVIKDLKVKGASSALKQGSVIKNIRLREGSDENVQCKVDGFGTLFLKSEFLKKL
jgi:protein PhnA